MRRRPTSSSPSAISAASFPTLRSSVTRFEPGNEVAPGIVTLPAPGHTPGHTVFAIHSGDQSLMVLSDTAQHPAVFARHPDWQAAFDVDGDAAVATRKKLFDRAAADRMLVTGYHFPFPACGHLLKTAERLRARSGTVAADACSDVACPRRRLENSTCAIRPPPGARSA